MGPPRDVRLASPVNTQLAAPPSRVLPFWTGHKGKRPPMKGKIVRNALAEIIPISSFAET